MKDITEHLKTGGVIAYPTDTVWGLGADVYNETAVEKVFHLKEQAPSKAISILVRDLYQAKELAVITPKIEKFIQLFWPGAVTFVLPSTDKVATKIHAGTGFVGLRQSPHPWVREFFKHYENPITTTSINVSGQPSATSEQELQWLPASVLRANNDFKDSASQASTVVKVENQKVFVLREGAVSGELIIKSWDQVLQ